MTLVRTLPAKVTNVIPQGAPGEAPKAIVMLEARTDDAAPLQVTTQLEGADLEGIAPGADASILLTIS